MRCPEDYVGRWLSILYRMTMSHVAQELKAYGIGSGQAMFLLELFHRDGMRQEELSRLLNIDGANTTRAITKLVQEGYVVRRPDPEDGRAYRIYLTEKAVELRADLCGVLRRWDDYLLAGLTHTEKALFLQLLKKTGQAVADTGRCSSCELSTRCS